MELALGTVQFGLVFGKKPISLGNFKLNTNQTESVSFEGFVLFGLKGRIINK